MLQKKFYPLHSFFFGNVHNSSSVLMFAINGFCNSRCKNTNKICNAKTFRMIIRVKEKTAAKYSALRMPDCGFCVFYAYECMPPKM